MPTAADDMTILSDNPYILQSLIAEVQDYSSMEQYLLQPTKSVIMQIKGSKRKSATNTNSNTWTIYNEEMPVVEETNHMGILRSSVSDEVSVTANMKKARRTLYSLMASGLHGRNGLDPETSIHLYQTYVAPVLLYGLEILLPNQKCMDMLEIMNKKFLKQILSMSTNTADPAVYIISGTIPVEGLIHKKALSFFGNICRLQDDSVEKQLAERQLSVKTYKSNSWFVAIKGIRLKYELPDPLYLLKNAPSKFAWKNMLNRQINLYWTDRIRHNATMYNSLKNLSTENYSCGKVHPLIQGERNAHEVPRINTKIKIATGTYILQVNRSAFNQNIVDPTCQMCHKGDETMEHFLLECTELSNVRKPILDNILDACSDLYNPNNDAYTLLQTIIDCSATLRVNTRNNQTINVLNFEYQCRRLCYSLHCERYKKLSLTPTRKRHVKKK